MQAPGRSGALFQLTALAAGASAVCTALDDAGLAALLPSVPATAGRMPSQPGGLAGAAGAVRAALEALEAALAAASGAEVAVLPELAACACAPLTPDMLQVPQSPASCRYIIKWADSAYRVNHKVTRCLSCG